MNLRQFLHKNGIGIRAFARKAKLDPATVHRLVTGQMSGAGLASKTYAKIMAATNGQVTPNDLILPDRGPLTKVDQVDHVSR